MEPKLAGRVPKIALLRPKNRTRPEQASELLLNADQNDFDDVNRWETFDNIVRHALPKYIANRVIAFGGPRMDEERFASLTKLIADDGLEPIPEF